MRQMVTELEELGFAPLGVTAERRPLARTKRMWTMGNPEDGSFAVIEPIRNEAWLQFVTPFEGGATVITADYRRPSVEEPGYLAGGLPAGSPIEVLAAHRRRVQRLVDDGKQPVGRASLDARVETCSAFYSHGPGKREIRRREVKGMMFTTVAPIWIGLMVAGALRR
jgi:hypothetical protein